MIRIKKCMKKSIVKIVCFAMFFFCCFIDRNMKVCAEGIGELYAQAAVLMDAETGRVLYGKNEMAVLPMASTTKIMTCILALENGDMNDEVKVSSYAATMPDVQLNIKEGETYRLEDLLYSIMLESHNDSAVAIAEHIGGSVEGFAILMNQKAKQIGANDTCFITPNGLDATGKLADEFGNEKTVFHSTTAKDLAKIMRYCLKESSKRDEFKEITQKDAHSFTDCEQKRDFLCNNHNSLLWKRTDAISGKTGFTNKAGYCYVGAIENEGRTYIVALLACGWPYNKNYKWKDCERLFTYGLEHYELVAANDGEMDFEIPKEITVENGCFSIWSKDEQGSVPIVVKESNKESPKALLKDGEEWEISYTVVDKVDAPVSQGKKVGEVNYMLDGTIYESRDIVTTQFIERINLKWCIEQIWQYALRRL